MPVPKLINLSSLQALRARHEGRTREEAFHLVKARHWSLGHNVVLRSLVSEAIINGEEIDAIVSIIPRKRPASFVSPRVILHSPPPPS